MLSLIARRLACPAARYCSIGSRGMSAAASSKAIEGSKSPEELINSFEDAEVRLELSKLRDAESDLMSQLKSTDVEIDWDSWKKELKYPSLVDEMKKEFDGAPMLDVEGEHASMVKEVDTLFDPIIAQYDTMAKEAEAETLEIEQQLKDVQFVRDNIQDLSLEEFLERYPSVKKSLESDISNNKWFTE